MSASCFSIAIFSVNAATENGPAEVKNRESAINYWPDFFSATGVTFTLLNRLSRRDTKVSRDINRRASKKHCFATHNNIGFAFLRYFGKLFFSNLYNLCCRALTTGLNRLAFLRQDTTPFNFLQAQLLDLFLKRFRCQ